MIDYSRYGDVWRHSSGASGGWFGGGSGSGSGRP